MSDELERVEVDGDGRRRARVQVSIDPEVWEAMKRSADDNFRTYSAEVEVACRKHLRAQRERGDDAPPQ